MSGYQIQVRHKGIKREELKRQVAEVEQKLKAEWGVEPIRNHRFVDNGDNVVFIWTKP